MSHLKEFIEKVEKMRTYQKIFFNNSDREIRAKAVRECKGLEPAVDKLLPMAKKEYEEIKQKESKNKSL